MGEMWWKKDRMKKGEVGGSGDREPVEVCRDVN